VKQSSEDKSWHYEQSRSSGFNTRLMETLANTIAPTEDKSYVPGQLKVIKNEREDYLTDYKNKYREYRRERTGAKENT
jgi:hypothetical protein